MEIVDTCTAAPGCCQITGTSDGLMLDTRVDTNRLGRIYLSVAWLGEVCTLLGAVGPDEQAERERELQDQLVAQAHRIAELEAEVERLRDDSVTGDYDRLRAAVAETINHGFVVDPKTGVVRLRQARRPSFAKDGGKDIEVTTA